MNMLFEYLADYGLFLVELMTIVALFLVIIAIVISLKSRQHIPVGELTITDLGEAFTDNTKKLAQFHLEENELKALEKKEKKAKKVAEKAKAKEAKKQKEDEDNTPARLFVLDFNGDVSASETHSLREEISTILSVAKPQDEVLLRLESPGGVVHGYGLAASQLARLKQHHIPLTIAVDKVAASGGYMMACVANKIVAAPFAIVGSIGVVAQIPNVHRLLKKHDVDVDVMTAGEYKRTMTIFGENTRKGKKKFQQELEETHILFKNFVEANRPQVDIDTVTTGEHWFGEQAIALKLIDEIGTSDDLILEAIKTKKVLKIKYTVKKSLLQKIGQQTEESASHFLLGLLKRNEKTLL